ncbi:hypothetical protein [Haloplasma contractile]|uniref:Uncharacterized protein n=1 Tax=Haloplasma contractile SSD-17B TaxID=1033810 RepID=U2EFR3_9MOLU|nr:hypothetical protein [Haloplasma contractile]ERJ13768.1 hypothetical protein HLPCO_000434 [Haloplasma contractile SSD-17B]
MANKHKKKKNKNTTVQPNKHRDNNILHSKLAKFILLIMALAFTLVPVATLVFWIIELSK